MAISQTETISSDPMPESTSLREYVREDKRAARAEVDRLERNLEVLRENLYQARQDWLKFPDDETLEETPETELAGILELAGIYFPDELNPNE